MAENPAPKAADKPKDENVKNDESSPEGTTSKLVEKEFYVVPQLDPRRQIPGSSQYLDDVERERAEVIRAKVEDREPDLDNPPPTQGTLVLTKEQVEQTGLSTADVDPWAKHKVRQTVAV